MTCSELQPMTSPLLVFRALHFLNPRIWNWLQPGYWRSLSRPQILESLVPGGREWPRHLDFHEGPRRAHVGGEGTEPLRMQLWQVGLQVAVMGPCCQLGCWEWKSGGRREQVGRGRWGDSASPLGGVSIAGGRAGPRRGTMSIGQAWKQLLEGPVTLSRAASFTQDRPRQANRKAVFRQCFPVWDQGLPSWCSSGCNSASIAAKGLHLDLLPDPVWFLLAAPLLPSPAPLRLTDLSSGYICPPPHRSPLYC